MAFLVAFLIVPVAEAVRAGFFYKGRLTGFWFGRVFTDLAVREGLLNALKVALATTVGVFAVAVPLAVLANNYDFRGKNVATALLMVPMILPPFVGALAMKKLLAYEIR